MDIYVTDKAFNKAWGGHYLNNHGIIRYTEFVEWRLKKDDDWNVSIMKRPNKTFLFTFENEDEALLYQMKYL